jgi:hypothetical protein
MDIGMGGFEWTVEDLIESPYASVSGVTEVALVGKYTLTSGSPGRGSMFMVDAATGQVTSFVREYFNAGFDAGFNAITIANNPFGGSAGYAIAGYSIENSTASPTYNMWALKISPGGAVHFSSTPSYTGPAISNEFGYDILERFSTTYGWEYFLGGYTDNGNLGGDDEVIFILGPTGFPAAPANQITYGGPGRERILQLDMYNAGVPAANLGLNVFGWTQGSFPVLGQVDFHQIKSYFNGVTACSDQIQDQGWIAGPLLADSTKGDTLTVFNPRNLNTQVAPLARAVICSAASMPTGSNLRIVQPSEISASSLFPNPVSAENAVVNITFDTPGANDLVEIDVWNAIGQLVMHKRETLADGQSQLQLNLGNGLSNGVYNVTVRRGSEMTNHKVSVQ